MKKAFIAYIMATVMITMVNYFTVGTVGEESSIISITGSIFIIACTAFIIAMKGSANQLAYSMMVGSVSVWFAVEAFQMSHLLIKFVDSIKDDTLFMCSIIGLTIYIIFVIFTSFLMYFYIMSKVK